VGGAVFRFARSIAQARCSFPSSCKMLQKHFSLPRGIPVPLSDSHLNLGVATKAAHRRKAPSTQWLCAIDDAPHLPSKIRADSTNGDRRRRKVIRSAQRRCGRPSHTSEIASLCKTTDGAPAAAKFQRVYGIRADVPKAPPTHHVRYSRASVGRGAGHNTGWCPDAPADVWRTGSNEELTSPPDKWWQERGPDMTSLRASVGARHGAPTPQPPDGLGKRCSRKARYSQFGGQRDHGQPCRAEEESCARIVAPESWQRGPGKQEIRLVDVRKSPDLPSRCQLVEFALALDGCHNMNTTVMILIALRVGTEDGRVQR